MAADVALQGAPSGLTAHRRSLRALTGIRFFAAFYVVVYHTRLGQALYDKGYHPAGNFFMSGYLAVPLFFLLSGFILAYTYEGQIEKPGDHRRFWEARFSRVWPVYAVSLIMASVASMTVPPVGIAVAAFAMVQAWDPFNPNLAGVINVVCWTLSVEAVFYLLFPWVQTWIEERSSKAQLWWIAAMLALCVAINSTSRTLGSTPHGAWKWIPLPLPHLPEFFSGVTIGNYFLRRLSLKNEGRVQTLVDGNGLWTYGSTALVIGLLCCPPTRLTSVVVAAFAALLYGLAAESTLLSRFLSTRIAVLGGGISYSIYLVQMPVKLWVQAIADRAHLASETVRFALFAVALIGVSLLLFRTVEDPARKVLRAIFARLEARREGVLARQV